VSTAGVLELQNSDLEAAIARSTSGDKVREAAIAGGMLDPLAGDAKFLHARPGVDPALAAKRMTPPSDSAIDVMANGGKIPNTTVPLAGAPAVTAVAAATPTPAPTVTQATATATPIPTPVPTAVPGTGAAAAPQG
jgi:hypothetical protein